MDRKKIEKRLSKLEKEQIVLFAYRCSLRALPFLSYKSSNFDYWEEKRRKTHIVSLFRAIDFVFLYSQKKKNNDLIVFGDGFDIARNANAAYARTAAYATRAATYAVYAANAAAYADVADAAYATATVAYVAYAVAADYGDFIEKNIVSDLKDLKNNQDIIYKPLFEFGVQEFKTICLNFEESLKKIGLDYWADVFKQHIENKINIANFKQRLNIPPEVVQQGGESITSYLISLKKETTFEREVKIHFVGNGEAGKTCLKDLICERKFKEHSATPGTDHDEVVNVDVENIGKVQAYLWDFGGQETMHPVHSFFFSERSIYLLVLDGRKGEDPEYWLEMIGSYAEECKILVVLNKQDENRAFNFDKQFLKTKYPNIFGFYPLSCKERDNYENEIKIFREDLKKALVEAGHKTSEVAVDWIKLKNAIQNDLKNEDFISYDEYRALCQECNIDDKNEQETVLKFLNDLGILLYYPNQKLQYTEVINPKWVTCAVYKFLHDDKIIKNEGSFDDNYFNEVLKKLNESGEYKYPKEHRKHILYLMEKFFVAFKVHKENRYLIPVLLKYKMPEKLPFNKDSSIKIEIRYKDFFPKNIVPDFICLNSLLIYENAWKTGVVLKENNKENYILVQSDEKAKKINLYASGDEPKSFLTYIRGVFEYQIHSRIKNLKVSEFILLPDRTKFGEERYVEYDNLIGIYKQEEWTYTDGIVGKQYSITELLKRVEHLEDTQKRMQEQRFDINLYLNLDLSVKITAEVRLNTSLLISEFNDLKDEMLSKSDNKLKQELEVVEKSLNKLEKTVDKNEMLKTGALSKFVRFLEKLDDTSSEFGKVLDKVEKGHKILSKLAEGYNNIAEWIALPQIPKFFLKKKK